MVSQIDPSLTEPSRPAQVTNTAKIQSERPVGKEPIRRPTVILAPETQEDEWRATQLERPATHVILAPATLEDDSNASDDEVESHDGSLPLMTQPSSAEMMARQSAPVYFHIEYDLYVVGETQKGPQGKKWRRAKIGKSDMIKAAVVLQGLSIEGFKAKICDAIELEEKHLGGYTAMADQKGKVMWQIAILGGGPWCKNNQMKLDDQTDWVDYLESCAITSRKKMVALQMLKPGEADSQSAAAQELQYLLRESIAPDSLTEQEKLQRKRLGFNEHADCRELDDVIQVLLAIHKPQGTKYPGEGPVVVNPENPNLYFLLNHTRVTHWAELKLKDPTISLRFPPAKLEFEWQEMSALMGSRTLHGSPQHTPPNMPGVIGARPSSALGGIVPQLRSISSGTPEVQRAFAAIGTPSTPTRSPKRVRLDPWSPGSNQLGSLQGYLRYANLDDNESVWSALRANSISDWHFFERQGKLDQAEGEDKLKAMGVAPGLARVLICSFDGYSLKLARERELERDLANAST